VHQKCGVGWRIKSKFNDQTIQRIEKSGAGLRIEAKINNQSK